MLSDEEKGELEKIAMLELNRFIYGKHLSEGDIKDNLSILFEIIRKQSKEIEELKEDRRIKDLELKKQDKEIEELKRKERLIKTYKGNLPDNVELICLCKKDFERNISDDYISKDKIKAKIEEVDKDENASITDFIEYAKEYATQKLQSLLEKE